MAGLDTRTEAILDQPSSLSDGRSNNGEVGPRTEQICTRLMVRVVPVARCDEDAGIDAEHDRSDAACELLLGGGAASAVDVERFGITRLTDPDERFEWIVVEFGDEPVT